MVVVAIMATDIANSLIIIITDPTDIGHLLLQGTGIAVMAVVIGAVMGGIAIGHPAIGNTGGLISQAITVHTDRLLSKVIGSHCQLLKESTFRVVGSICKSVGL